MAYFKIISNISLERMAQFLFATGPKFFRYSFGPLQKYLKEKEDRSGCKSYSRQYVSHPYISTSIYALIYSNLEILYPWFHSEFKIRAGGLVPVLRFVLVFLSF